MPEEDLQLYAAYAADNPLPHARLELQLAQLAQMVHGAAGGPGSPALNEFMFRNLTANQPAGGQAGAGNDDDEDDNAAFVAAAFGFNPINKPHASKEGTA